MQSLFSTPNSFGDIWCIIASMVPPVTLLTLSELCRVQHAFWNDDDENYHGSPRTAWSNSLQFHYGSPGVGNGRRSFQSMLGAEQALQLHECTRGHEDGWVQVIDGFASGVMMSEAPTCLLAPNSWSGSLVKMITRMFARDQATMHRELHKLRACLNHGAPDFSSGLLGQFGTLMRMFKGSDVRYELNYMPSHTRKLQLRFQDGMSQPAPQYGLLASDYPQTGTNGYVDFKKGTSWHAHESDLICFTQAVDACREERIQYYREIIAKGKRPIIFAVESGHGDRFLLDGHHKFLAYLDFPEIEPAWLTVALEDDESAEEPTEVRGHGPFSFYCSCCRRADPREKLFLTDEKSRSAYIQAMIACYGEAFSLEKNRDIIEQTVVEGDPRDWPGASRN